MNTPSAATWHDRLERGYEAFQEWHELPTTLLLNRVFKAAGFREVIIENGRLAEKVAEREAEIKRLRARLRKLGVAA